MWVGVFLDEGQDLRAAISSAVKILEGAYSFVIISILDPEAMYIVKNTGTMVIGFPESLVQKAKTGSSDNVSLDELSNISEEETKAGEAAAQHKFQIVSSDTTVF